ncbi:hypothetical protein KP509_03G030400 [Ceratopteris richardii]|uniref:Uncharacterized protein n=1 Tax=Ceratopteris richardii TaxID=49495 RepID=A0A8T2V2N2_CERRI|nr:hypothetical protein KP509_03G030400 [Ceratopteris richardii]
MFFRGRISRHMHEAQPKTRFMTAFRKFTKPKWRWCMNSSFSRARLQDYGFLQWTMIIESIHSAARSPLSSAASRKLYTMINSTKVSLYSMSGEELREPQALCLSLDMKGSYIWHGPGR